MVYGCPWMTQIFPGVIKECPGMAQEGPSWALYAGGELFMQLEREGIFLEDTAW